MIECTDGMSVETESPVSKKAQDGVLEFLLVNHPLDCPVCDKGGECPLQDQTMSYGPGESRFIEEKRHLEKPIPISETVYLDRERCILCDRCTRFAKDVAGDAFIHFQDRGNASQVNTFPDHPFASYFSGNTVQICPVGALTAKPFRFKARPWDLEQVESTCTSCSVGCRVVIDSSRDEVLRYTGVDSDPVNWSWLCDKGRFDFEYVNSDGRIVEPLLRTDAGQELGPAKWSYALKTAADAIKSGLDRSGPAGVGIIGGARLANEDAYAWAKLAKGVIGTDNVDAQLDDGLPAEFVLGLPRATIDEVCAPGGTVVVYAPDVKEELPVLFLRLRHAAVEDGVKIIELAATDTGLTPLAESSLRVRPGEAADVVAALFGSGTAPEGVDPTAFFHARTLLAGNSSVTAVIGRPSLAESADVAVAAAHRLLELIPSVTFLPALRRANVFGALDMGLAPGLLPGRVSLDEGRTHVAAGWSIASKELPAETGLDARGILEAAANGKLDTLVLLGADPLADFPDHDLAERALTGVRTLISVDLFLNESNRKADIVLPAAGYATTEGTTTNLEGRVTRLGHKVTAPGTARADWIIAVDLAHHLGGDLGVESLAELLDEISQVAPSHAGLGAALADPANRDGVVVPVPAGPPQPAAHPVEGNPADSSHRGSAEGAPAEPVVVPEGHVAGERREHELGPDPAPEANGDAAPATAPAGPAGPASVTLPSAPTVAAPVRDAYAHRLVVTRKLYDHGTLVQHAPAIAALAASSSPLRLNPADLDRLGIASGDRVRVTSERGSLSIDVVADHGVPKNVAALVFDQAGGAAGQLLTAGSLVTDIRVETQS
jgi:NADH-quinone oxidoreductase subunit G